MADPVTVPVAPAKLSSHAETEAQMHRLAAEMETAFLSEMLGHAGLGDTGETFGGGIGERQFSSFLREQQASAMVAAGGIGLAESLFRAMSEGRE
jgi:Rod binding domain-containing protein